MKIAVAIIGGGASGTLTALHVLQKVKEPATIFCIEKDAEKLFRGAAYSSTLPYEPLNVPAGKMSLYTDKPDDFYEWLQEHKGHAQEITRDSFFSRRWFGEYMQQAIEQAIEERASEVQFHAVQSATVQMNVNEKGTYTLTQDDGTTIVVNEVVFATGNELPADVISPEAKERLGDHYIADPWNGEAVAGIEPSADILYIGTGLTTIDHLVSAVQKGHTGKLYALSRNGALPQPHGPTQPYEFTRDVAEADVTVVRQNIVDEIQAASEKGVDWRSVIDALRPEIPRIWQTLSPESQQLFLKKYRNEWDIHRHRIPQFSAKTVDDILRTGQLAVIAGSITNIESREKRFAVIYKNEGTKKEVLTDYVVNCTGPSNDYRHGENQIFRSLLESGQMKESELGLGIVTGLAGEIIQKNGEPLPHCYAIGPLRKATEWESVAMREIRLQAEAYVQQIKNHYDI